MQTYQKASFSWLIIMGLLLSSCGQTASPSAAALPTISGRALTPPNPVKTPHQENLAGGVCKKIAFVIAQGGNSDIFSVCSDGNNLTKLTDSSSANSMPAWSPDGKSIAFSSSRTGSSQIYLMRADGSSPTRLTSDYQNDFPIWLPSGSQIAVRTTDAKGLWWWRIVTIENSQVTQFTDPSYDFFFQTPAWSPDGQKIATMSLLEQKQRNDGSSQIHVKNMDGSHDVALTSDTWANIKPAWSPDGKKIAFLSERDGKYNLFALYVMAADGREVKKLSNPVYSESAAFAWSSDGQEIAISGDEAIGKIFIVNVNTGNQRELLAMSAGAHASFPAWQP